ncbi:MAG TPA: D-sedoheptulose 7-phosphate isomerase [Pyrinomonadaceae bacterium]|jgi:D-sedoheptulose 7-phosphate isomerase|nr:D-sedoheptulose 7-phosphate isomerase [Pyrinomonadaceae bacterium]
MLDRISAIVSASLELKRRYFAEHSLEVERAALMIADVFRAGGKLLLFGNGGSAADAQHIAGEFVNRFSLEDRRALPALALSTDGGVLTCIANDTGFEKVFARQVEALGARGDACLAISTSGKSENIVLAIREARARQMKVIGLLGRDGGLCAPLCDVALVVPSDDTQRIQETHNLMGHILCELVEQALFGPERE